MGFLAYFLIVFVIVILWQIRPLVAFGLGWLMFIIASPFYRKRAEESIMLVTKLQEEDKDDKAEQLVSRYRHRFWGLKITGFVLLVGYAYISAVLIYAIFNFWWVWWVVFLCTMLFNWQGFVTNISVTYLLFIEEKMNKRIIGL